MHKADIYIKKDLTLPLNTIDLYSNTLISIISMWI